MSCRTAMSPCSASMSDLPAGAPGRGRIGLLDAWRTLAILSMVVYHFLYDLAFFGRMRWETFYSPVSMPCSSLPAAALSFWRYFLPFSHSNLRRARSRCCADSSSWRGGSCRRAHSLRILQLLGVSMLIYGFAAAIWSVCRRCRCRRMPRALLRLPVLDAEHPGYGALAVSLRFSV